MKGRGQPWKGSKRFAHPRAPAPTRKPKACKWASTRSWKASGDIKVEAKNQVWSYYISDKYASIWYCKVKVNQKTNGASAIAEPERWVRNILGDYHRRSCTTTVFWPKMLALSSNHERAHWSLLKYGLPGPENIMLLVGICETPSSHMFRAKRDLPKGSCSLYTFQTRYTSFDRWTTTDARRVLVYQWIGGLVGPSTFMRSYSFSTKNNNS